MRVKLGARVAATYLGRPERPVVCGVLARAFVYEGIKGSTRDATVA